MEYRHGLVLILIISNIMLSAFAIYQESTDYGFCVTGADCKIVQDSVYANLLGIPLGLIGLIAFLGLLFLWIRSYSNKEYKKLLLLASFVGAVLASYFIYIQVFVLKAICSTCITLDTITIVIFALLLADSLHDQSYF